MKAPLDIHPRSFFTIANGWLINFLYMPYIFAFCIQVLQNTYHISFILRNILVYGRSNLQRMLVGFFPKSDQIVKHNFFFFFLSILWEDSCLPQIMGSNVPYHTMLTYVLLKSISVKSTTMVFLLLMLNLYNSCSQINYVVKYLYDEFIDIPV